MLLLSLIALFGCRAPPEAPAELDDLSSYLYTHFKDEDPEALQVGLNNLDLWLQDHLQETLEGYTVSNLDQATIDTLGAENPDLTGLVGAAVGYQSLYPTEEHVSPILTYDPISMYPSSFVGYARCFDDHLDCFVDGSCDQTQVENYHETSYPMGLEVTSESVGQYRWVEGELGTYLMHRTWLKAPAEVNADWVAVNGQYYLRVFLPWEDGALQLQITWIVAELVDAPADGNLALNLVIDSMQTNAEEADEFMTADAGNTPLLENDCTYANDDDLAPEVTDEQADDGGCGCSAGRAGGPALLALLGLAAILRRRDN